MPQQLPEGTDHVVNGAGVGPSDDDALLEIDMADDIDTPAPAHDTGGATADTGRTTGGAGGTGETPTFFARIEELRGQGYDKARDYAEQGKSKATDALDDLLRTINDAAEQIDSKLGGHYGDYARRAAEGIGSFNDSLKGKDVDQLFADARDLVGKAPAVTIGAAAALGFVVARLARSGMPEAGVDKPEGPKA